MQRKMETDTKSEASRGGDSPANAIKKANCTQEQHDKIVALQQRMREHFHPLPPQLLNLTRILPHQEGETVEHDPEWFYCACFLLSREWDVAKAFAMMQTVVAYRAANQLDDRSQLPPAVSVRGWADTTAVCASLGKAPRRVPDRIDRVVAGVRETFACGIHYWDKGGRPVVYVLIDSLDEPGLIRVLKRNAKIGQRPADVLWEFIQHYIGVGEDVVVYQLQQQRLAESETKAKAVGGDADGSSQSAGIAQGVITLVVDLRGLHMGLLWKPMLDLFREVAKELFQYYPDMVHRILAVNAPSLVRVAFNLVKGVMPVDFQNKFSFVAPKHTLAALEEEIESAHIPAFLGGGCQCAALDGHGGGGCIDGYNREDPRRRRTKAETTKGNGGAASSVTAGHSDSGLDEDEGGDATPTEDVVLSAGQRHRRVFALQPSETVVWEFAVSHDSGDVVFAAYFIPCTDDSSSSSGSATVNWSKAEVKKLEPHEVRHAEAARQADAFTATEGGTLVLSWHNTRSWFTTRTVQLRVYKDSSPPSDSEEHT